MNDGFDLQAYHRKHHNRFRAEVSMDECWFCQRGWAVCKTKVAYDGPHEAVEHAKRIITDLGRSVLPYRCRYCRSWHLHTTRSRHDSKRAEKWRRKALWKETQ